MKKVILSLAVVCFTLACCTTKNTTETVEDKIDKIEDAIEDTFENTISNAIEEKLDKIEDVLESVEDKVEEVADSLINRPLLGGDRDEHGCIPSAGYIWCEKLQKCVRPWETPCE